MQAPLGDFDEQFARQLQDERRSRDAGTTNDRRLRELGRESALVYGRRLFMGLHGTVTDTLKTVLEEAAANPAKARVHGAALPYLDEFNSPEQIAAVALVGALDQLHRKQRQATFCQHIGKALEDEHRLMRLQSMAPMTQRKLLRSTTSRRRMASKATFKELGLPCPSWNDKARFHVGALLLDVLTQSTGLIQVVKKRIGRTTPYFVLPTEEALAFIRSCPPAVTGTSFRAMVCPPVPWTDLVGGGVLNNPDPLIRVPVQDMEEKTTTAIQLYRDGDMRMVLRAVNHLQAVPLQCSAVMPGLQRIAWDNGIDGLFPCKRMPPDVPDRLGDDPSPEDLRLRNRAAAIAHRDREKHRFTRVKIERAVQHAEDLAGRTVWQACQVDHRGRIYAVNRYVTHQGPDMEKSLLSFQPEPVGPDGIDWILKAAAGHYGLTRSTWSDRLQWGQDHREQMLSAAQDPLGRLELWRSAKDPWQFLQLCQGLQEALETGATGVPIRLDQTTSGLGILSAMTRQREIGRLCNLWGHTPRDLYTVVADRVNAKLRQDLELGETDKERVLAQLWLDYGVTRSTVKGPVLATPYGGRYMSVCDTLVDLLDDHHGFVPMKDFNYRVAVPAKYLAGHLWRELNAVVSPCMVVKAWLNKTVRKALSQNIPLEWTSPSGLPMRVADRMITTTKVETMLYGMKRSLNMADAPLDAKLDATAANRAACANFVHQMDAAYLTLVTDQLAERHIPVVTNHDCFATSPGHASELHNLLLTTFSGLYRTDWLAVIREEMQARTGLSLPKLPAYGELCPGEIGNNPYVFS